MEQLNINRYKQRAYKKKKTLKAWMKTLFRKRITGLEKIVKKTAVEVWQEIDCLNCANCCKTMTPTYTKSDIKRISTHFKMTPKAFYEKWLAHDDNDDVINETTPCQFLGKDNKCTIYAIRPADCKGFPHFTKKPFKDYDHVFIDNLHRCPATLRFVEKLKENVEALA